MKQLMMILVCALGLAACSSQYIMSTKDGKMINTQRKAKVEEGPGKLRYYDHEGREVMIKQDDVTQILER